MPRYLVSAETTFSAAHTLPGVERCEQLHGHNWRVRLTVTVAETALDPAGMGLDFRIVEQLAREAVAEFDHRYLNDLAPFRDAPPTAERIAKVVSDRAADRLGRDGAAAAVEEVEVWETSAYRVVYRPQ